MTKIKNRGSRVWTWAWRACMFSLLLLGVGLVGSTVISPAQARTRVFLGFHFGAPLYYPYYYHPYPYWAYNSYYYSYDPYYYAPPVVVTPAPVVVQQPCTNGVWRFSDGTEVSGVACRQPDGTWRMAE